jgi:hypothetical protein
MHSPAAVLERIKPLGGKIHSRRSDTEPPEIVIVQKRSIKYAEPPETRSVAGTHLSPRFEFGVRSHIRRQPLRRFGKNEDGKWNVVEDRIIPPQIRCRGKGKPLVVTKVAR